MVTDRKNQTAAVRFGPVLMVLFICFTIGGAGVGFVWQKKSIEQLATQRKDSERRLDQLQKRNQDLRSTYERHTSPPALERKVRELGLGLIKPEPEQVRVLLEPFISRPYEHKRQVPDSSPTKIRANGETMIAVQTIQRNYLTP